MSSIRRRKSRARVHSVAPHLISRRAALKAGVGGLGLVLSNSVVARAISASPSQPVELRIIRGSELSTLDPNGTTSATDLAIIKNIVDGSSQN